MFAAFARSASRAMGMPSAFAVALVFCLLWLFFGPLIDSELNWRGMLVINLPTIVTLLMVFLVQHTQNHHNDVVQIKLDELIRAMEGAHNVMVNLEELSPEELIRVRAKYQALAERVRAAPGGGVTSTNTPEVEAPQVVLK